MLCIVCILLISSTSEAQGKIHKDLRHPKDSNSSILAVSFGPIEALSSGVGKHVRFSILFVKFGSPGNGEESKIFASNYNKHGRAYLINAEPGKYAVIALLVRVKQSNLRIGIGIRGGNVTSSSYYSDTSGATFFSEEIVKKSTVEIKPGELVFAGNFLVKKLPDVTKGDSAQQRYYREFVELVEKEDPALANVKVKKKKIKKKPKRRCARGVLKKHEPLDMTSFLRIKSDFRGTGWNDIIQKRWQEVLDKKKEDADTGAQ